jgi:hypothetical protein
LVTPHLMRLALLQARRYAAYSKWLGSTTTRSRSPSPSNRRFVTNFGH